MSIHTYSTFLVRFGGKLGEFGRDLVRILARRNISKIPSAYYAVEEYQEGTIRYLP